MSIYIHVLYFIRNHRTNSKGTAPIYMRITIDGQRAEISTSRRIEPDRWDKKSNTVKGRKPEAKSINRHLDQMKQKVYDAQFELTNEGKPITAKSLKARITGSDKKQKELVEAFQEHNVRMKSLIGKDYSEATYKKYYTALEHLKAFLIQKYGHKNLLMLDIDHQFLDDFEYFLKTSQGHSHNTAMKYIGNFKKVVKNALKQGWVERDPFEQYDHSFEKKDPVFLSQDELDRLEQKKFDIERLDRVRDIFVFSCYTALSFSDAEKLSTNDISKDKNGEYYLAIPRTKTGNTSKIMLLPKALEIIKKYEDDPETSDGNMLPMISNQKTNAYLKEIADLCKIHKKLTHHVARHTAATTVFLANGVPIETVQEIMGHADLRSTQHYARVTPDKVNKDMTALRTQLSKTG